MAFIKRQRRTSAPFSPKFGKRKVAQKMEGWKELEKAFKGHKKKIPMIMKRTLKMALTPLNRQAKKNLPDRGRGWKKKYGIESGVMKKFITKEVRVNRQKGYIWGGVGVKEGSVVKSVRDRKSGKIKTVKHIPWKIDHLIEFGFYHKKSGKYIPPYPFLRNAKKQTEGKVLSILRKDLQPRIVKDLTKRTKKTKAPFR